MNDHEKLVELIRNSLKKNIGKSCMLAENIADDLLEHGVIVPPMSIGQTCFVLGYDFRERKDCVVECKVSCLTQKKNGTYTIRNTNLKYKTTHNFTPDEIGKTVFLTREEAEKALKGE